jgi:arylsulfatase
MVADDLAYGDIGAYGGEIHTPNLDQLAQQGAKFTAFYTQASCSPTRSILLTGVDNHQNGLGTMAEDRLPHQNKLPGYVGYLNDRVVTIAQLLKDGGYDTYMAGKWHLGVDKKQRPAARGFQQSYALLHGGGNHFNDNGNNTKLPKVIYSRNGEITKRPNAVYSSDLFTGKLLGFIDEQKNDERPFFAYLAFTAPHFPLQAPKALIQKYSSRYVDGWDKIRAKRFSRMKALALVEPSIALPPRLSTVPAWHSLSKREQLIEAKKMAVYAAMVDNLDQNVGKVIAYLKAKGLYDNTIIVFMSDNGADPYDRSHRAIYKDYFKANYNNSLENMGAADSYWFNGPGWAQVGSVYQRDYKFLLSEGGIHAPFIMRYPGVVDDGKNRIAFASVYDIVPTFLQAAKLTHPGVRYGTREIFTTPGRSMLPYLRNDQPSVYSEREAVSMEIFGHGVVFMGAWKAVKLRPPISDNQWHLYNLERDPTESNDRSMENPNLLASMIQKYEQYRKDNGVISEPDGVTAYPEIPQYRDTSKIKINESQISSY